MHMRMYSFSPSLKLFSLQKKNLYCLQDYSVDVIVCGGLVTNNVTQALLATSEDCPGTRVFANKAAVCVIS